MMFAFLKPSGMVLVSIFAVSGRTAWFSNHIPHVWKNSRECYLNWELFQVSFIWWVFMNSWNDEEFDRSLQRASQAVFCGLRVMIVIIEIEMFSWTMHDLFYGEGLAIRCFLDTSRQPDEAENLLGSCRILSHVSLVCISLTFSGLCLSSDAQDLSEGPVAHLCFLFEVFLIASHLMVFKSNMHYSFLVDQMFSMNQSWFWHFE